MKHRKIQNNGRILNTTEGFQGKSLEEKVFEAVNSKAPIEAVAPMVYTERKDGVLPETNIRTDRFEVAQEAMTNIAEGIRVRRAKRLFEANKPNENKMDKPASGSGNSTTQTSVQNN